MFKIQFLQRAFLIGLLVVLQDQGAHSMSAVNRDSIAASNVGFNGMTSFKLKSGGGGASPSVGMNSGSGNNSRKDSKYSPIMSNELPEEDDADRTAKALLNAKRAEHGSQPLEFCRQTKALALECALSYQSYKESTGTTPLFSNLPACNANALGNHTNVFFYETPSRMPVSAYSAAIEDWYDEEDAEGNSYRYRRPVEATLEEYQHQTQIIWNSTLAFGTACSPTPLNIMHSMSSSTASPQNGGEEAASTTASSKPSSNRRNSKTYICSFAFVPGGNIRRRFGPESLDEYKKNVAPPMDP